MAQESKIKILTQGKGKSVEKEWSQEEINKQITAFRITFKELFLTHFKYEIPFDLKLVSVQPQLSQPKQFVLQISRKYSQLLFRNKEMCQQFGQTFEIKDDKYCLKGGSPLDIFIKFIGLLKK